MSLGPELTLYIVYLLDDQAYLTKIVKALFLSDYISKKILNHRISGIRWIKHLYGPWSYEVHTALDLLRNLGYVNEVATSSLLSLVGLPVARRFRVKKLGRAAVERYVRKLLTQREDSIVRCVCGRLRKFKLEQVLRLVYVLPEVRYARSGEEIRILPHPDTLLNEVRSCLREMGLDAVGGIDELEEKVNEIPALIERGLLPEHPTWEKYIELRGLVGMARELYRVLDMLSSIFNLAF
ncbi:MAG: hypothetical protein DRJ40_08990 [Thermoprotei archaeon]|nr:MAG: hypothetical protein DRJ40_08990 [Thermoprotei archaeon]